MNFVLIGMYLAYIVASYTMTEEFNDYGKTCCTILPATLFSSSTFRLMMNPFLAPGLFAGLVCIINTDPASVFVINDLKPFYPECSDHIIFSVLNC